MPSTFVGRLPSFAGVSPANLLPTHWHPYLGPWSYCLDFFGANANSSPKKLLQTASLSPPGGHEDWGIDTREALQHHILRSRGAWCHHVPPSSYMAAMWDARDLTWFHANRYINIAQWSSLHAKKTWLLNNHDNSYPPKTKSSCNHLTSSNHI